MIAHNYYIEFQVILRVLVTIASLKRRMSRRKMGKGWTMEK